MKDSIDRLFADGDAVGGVTQLLEVDDAAFTRFLQQRESSDIEGLVNAFPYLGPTIKVEYVGVILQTMNLLDYALRNSDEALQRYACSLAKGVLRAVLMSTQEIKAATQASVQATRKYSDTEVRRTKDAQMIKKLEEAHAELETKQRELEYLATHDELTDLFNRRKTKEQWEEHKAEAIRYRKQLSFVLSDIDHFKAINDDQNGGHEAGDYVLRELAKLLVASVRAPIDKVGRWGGEEFVFILPETTEEGATQLAEKLRKQVEGHPFDYHGRIIPVTMSFGVKGYEPGEPMKRTVALADKCLYAAKNTGRNRVVRYDALESRAK